jgi:predicted house-cleaning noncanonical NTP pyrophosphatase (MazG superfamily)
MSSQIIQEMLGKKENNADRISMLIAGDASLLPDVIDGLDSPGATVKFKSAKILRILSDNRPEILYPYFDFFMNLTQNSNNIIKWNAIDIIAGLSSVDSDDKFPAVFNSFYGLMEAGELITAAHVVENSDKIAKARPELMDRITQELLKVERVPLPTEECRNILTGKTIEALGKCFRQIENQEEVVAFVKKQLGNTRNATKKKAEAFLKKI